MIIIQLLIKYITTFLYFIITKMDETNLELDVELESEAQMIANYEDELLEFKTMYRKNKEFRDMLFDKYKAKIVWEEWDECYGAYVWEDFLFMSCHIDKCLEKMYNEIERIKHNRIKEENDLPF